MTAIRIAIHGAAGRMGRRLVAMAGDDPELQLVAALEQSPHPDLGKDAGLVAGGDAAGILISPEMPPEVDVVIDFSVPTAAVEVAALCRRQGVALVMATTGLQPDQQDKIREAAETIPVVSAPSMSLAVNLAMRLSAQAGQVLKDYPGGADVEIVERHHRFKEDAPSGTALRFGQVISDVMHQTRHIHGREGQTGPRLPNEIGYHALRVGDNPGEHTIVFGLLGETIELTVRATNRDCYAHGALAAAKYVARQPAGLYSMNDVLGL